MHGLSDIFQVMHPSVFHFDAPSWAAAGYDGRASFKKFLERVSVDLTRGDQCWAAITRFDKAGRPVEIAAEKALHKAIVTFAEQAKVT